MERCAVESEWILFKVSQRGRGKEKGKGKNKRHISVLIGSLPSLTLFLSLGEFCQEL